MYLLKPILIALAVLWSACAGTVTSNGVSEPVIQESTTQQPATQPQSDEAVEPDDAGGPELPEHLDALLDRLEASSNDLKGFTAKITYQKYDDLLARREIRSGELLYSVDQESGNRSFALLFDRLVINRRQSDHLRHFIFDGRWLAEIDHEAQPKQFIKRELVAPGRTLDPLKLGEGPIPLPIGQAKQDVLDRYDVSDAVLPTEGLLSRLEADQVEGIRLVPRPGTGEADEFRHIDLFYDKTTNLPLGIDALELNEDRKTVRLRDVSHNPEFTPQMLSKLDITIPDRAEWRVVIEPWIGGD